MRRMQNKFLPEWHIPRHQYTDNLTDPENIHIRMHTSMDFKIRKRIYCGNIFDLIDISCDITAISIFSGTK